MFQIALGSLLGRFAFELVTPLAPTRASRISELAWPLGGPFALPSIPLRFP